MTDIALNTDTAAANSSAYRAWADQIEQHGAHEPIPREQLTEVLGDIFSPYAEAKSLEYDARAAAYQRVAAQARAHADKLDVTRNTFTNADEEHAGRIEAVARDTSGTGPSSPATPTPSEPSPEPSPDPILSEIDHTAQHMR